MFYEMAFKGSPHFQVLNMKIIGKMNYGVFCLREVNLRNGNHALVFLFRIFQGGSVQAVGASCCGSSCTTTVLKKLVLLCINMPDNGGAVVQAIT